MLVYAYKMNPMSVRTVYYGIHVAIPAALKYIMLQLP
ncbi:MAG: hypothetical protein ACFWTJ_11830 [Lachnoclostridium sp.]|jgi:hypothetical protein